MKNLLGVCYISVRLNALSCVYIPEDNVNVSWGYTLPSETKPQLIFSHIIAVRGLAWEMQIIVNHLCWLCSRFFIPLATCKTEMGTICEISQSTPTASQVVSYPTVFLRKLFTLLLVIFFTVAVKPTITLKLHLNHTLTTKGHSFNEPPRCVLKSLSLLIVSLQDNTQLFQ